MNIEKTGKTCIEKKYKGFEKPVDKIKRWKRNIRFIFQRVKYGYCDSDVWSIDYWFLMVMPGMLKQLKDTTHSYPDFCGNTSHALFGTGKSDDVDNAGMKKWDDILSEMIFLLNEIFMDEGYEKIMEIIEMNRFRQRLGLLDYTACREEPDRVKGLDIEATKNRVCDLIKSKGLKDKTIADKLGITPQAVNKWRHKGSFFVIENLYVLSGLLGVSVDNLLVPVAVKKWEVLIEKR